MLDNQTAAHVAAIYSAAWWVRDQCRPGQAERRARALAELARAIVAALTAGSDPEPVLYAICDSLASSPDVRFAVRR